MWRMQARDRQALSARRCMLGGGTICMSTCVCLIIRSNWNPFDKNKMLWHKSVHSFIGLVIFHHKTLASHHLSSCKHMCGTVAAIYKADFRSGPRCVYKISWLWGGKGRSNQQKTSRDVAGSINFSISTKQCFCLKLMLHLLCSSSSLPLGGGVVLVLRLHRRGCLRHSVRQERAKHHFCQSGPPPHSLYHTPRLSWGPNDVQSFLANSLCVSVFVLPEARISYWSPDLERNQPAHSSIASFLWLWITDLASLHGGITFSVYVYKDHVLYV